MATTPESLIVTDAAAARVRELIAARGDEPLKLRVYVQGGGCSGFQYGFALEQDAAEDDTRVEAGGVTVLVDPLSAQYLAGSEVDFVNNLEGARFVVRNPNATTTCGCGASFGI